MVISYRCFGTTSRSHRLGPGIKNENDLFQFGVYIGKNVGSCKFSVAWCQPIGLMQVVEREGSVVVRAALMRKGILLTGVVVRHG